MSMELHDRRAARIRRQVSRCILPAFVIVMALLAFGVSRDVGMPMTTKPDVVTFETSVALQACLTLGALGILAATAGFLSRSLFVKLMLWPMAFTAVVIATIPPANIQKQVVVEQSAYDKTMSQYRFEISGIEAIRRENPDADVTHQSRLMTIDLRHGLGLREWSYLQSDASFKAFMTLADDCADGDKDACTQKQIELQEFRDSPRRSERDAMLLLFSISGISNVL